MLDWSKIHSELVHSIYPKMYARIDYLIHEFGSSKHENRPLFGNYVERVLVNMWNESTKSDWQFIHVPHCARIDVYIRNKKTKESVPVSIKYSSSGNIRLHNSMQNNKDMFVHNTIVITKDFICTLIPEYIPDITNYLVNKSAHLELKRSLFTKLKNTKYNNFYLYPKKYKLEKQSFNKSMGDLLEEYIENKFMCNTNNNLTLNNKFRVKFRSIKQ